MRLNRTKVGLKHVSVNATHNNGYSCLNRTKVGLKQQMG